MIFSSRMIDQWAEYSGDRNPVHFDRELATSMGYPREFCHGWLALLFVKSEVTTRLAASLNEDIAVDFRFRSPVYVREDVSCEMDKNETRYDIDLVNASRQKLVTGVLTPKPFNNAIDGAHRLHGLGRADRSLPDFGFPVVPWVEAEAYAFQQMLQKYPGKERIGVADDIFAEHLKDSRERWVLLHTRHESDVSLGLLQLTRFDGSMVRESVCEWSNPIPVPSGYYCSITLRLSLYTQGGLVSRIHLLMKRIN
ncbi:MaoC dehydratase-like protein [Rhizobium sp. SJZ105]|uniref:MaoC family dehydratase n=1 Tax=Rhizobium sp. SJZ105 TaxID=2572678 RepID=UPI0011A77C65|nr:MaoC dehydratase-like protein [Rhizobium sp. SJZ105]